jgi:hypothetical protein
MNSGPVPQEIRGLELSTLMIPWKSRCLPIRTLGKIVWWGFCVLYPSAWQVLTPTAPPRSDSLEFGG